MSNTIIRSFFNTTMMAWCAAQSPVVALARENEAFTPPSSGSYVEIYLMPAATVTPTIKANRFREIGLFQASLYTKPGIGTALQDTLVESLIATFPVTPKGVVSIEEKPYATRIHQEQSGWICCVVTIKYRYEP